MPKEKIVVRASEAHIKRYEDLLHVLHLRPGELFKLMLNITGWAVDEIQKGRSIGAIDHNGEHERLLFAELAAARTAGPHHADDEEHEHGNGPHSGEVNEEEAHHVERRQTVHAGGAQ